MREIQDLDFVITKKHRRGMEQLLTAAGYVPEAQFNALNGARRLLFLDQTHGRQIDVFVDRFEMCHELPLTERLTLLPATLPAAEVLMTKLQIVELNAKDRGDLYALLYSHEVADHDDQAINVDADHVADGGGLGPAADLRDQPRSPDRGAGRRRRSTTRAAPSIAGRIEALAAAIEAAPKSRRWKLRARVGERKRWYEEPEEVDRDRDG